MSVLVCNIQCYSQMDFEQSLFETNENSVEELINQFSEFNLTIFLLHK